MAQAVKVNPKEFDVQLTLSVAEAQTLYAVLQFIGGDPEKSRRRYMESVERALKLIPEVAIPYPDYKSDILDDHPCISFKNEDDQP